MAQITYADGARQYTLPSPDGKVMEKYWSVTTILEKGVPKHALKQWAANMAAEYAVANLPTLHTLVDRGRIRKFRPVRMSELIDLAPEGGLFEDPEKLEQLIALHTTWDVDEEAALHGHEEAVGLVSMAHKRTMKRAQLRGSDIHDAIEAYVKGHPYPGVPLQARAMYDQFLGFLEFYQPEFLQSELTIYNRTRRYAGRLDGIAIFRAEHVPAIREVFGKDEARLMIDVKSGKSIYPEVALQLNAYDNAEVAEVQGSGILVPHEKVDGAIALRLHDNFFQPIPVELSPRVWNVFLYAYEIARWAEDISKHVLGDPMPMPALVEQAITDEEQRRKDEKNAKARRKRAREREAKKAAAAAAAQPEPPVEQTSLPTTEGAEAK